MERRCREVARLGQRDVDGRDDDGVRDLVGHQPDVRLGRAVALPLLVVRALEVGRLVANVRLKDKAAASISRNRVWTLKCRCWPR